MNACTESDEIVDTTGIECTVNIERLDSLWFSVSAIRFRQEHPRLLEEYGDLYRLYIEDQLALGAADDSNLFLAVRQFVKHPDMAEVQQEVMRHFPDLKKEEAELEEVWKRYLYFFPERTVPKHLAYISGFGSSYAVTESAIGISLEKFLGADCRFYEYLALPVYQRTRMTRKHLVPWLIKTWVETDFPMTTDNPTLLEVMVHEGKVLYALDKLISDVEDSVKIGYTGREIQWATTHASRVWAHLVDKQLLFNSDPKTIAKFMADAPFTTDFVKESPGRMGHYIGWQIVRNFMRKNHEVDLDQLFEERDSRKILTLSKYKP